MCRVNKVNGSQLLARRRFGSCPVKTAEDFWPVRSAALCRFAALQPQMHCC